MKLADSGIAHFETKMRVLAALCVMAHCAAASADGAEWITGSYVVPGEDDYAAHFADAPAPVLKRVFALDSKPVRRAVWRIASPGMYDAYVNGTRVNSVALPTWTAFDRRVLEDEYDVTALVKGGANSLVLELGNGWWNPLPMKMWGRYNLRKTLPHGTPTAKATLAVEYADGTAERIATDGAWTASEGAVLRNNLYLGEKRDGRAACPQAAGRRDRPARIAKDPPKGKVVPRGEMPPVVVYDRWKAKSVTALPDGRWLVDMGVNFAGTIRATLRGTHDGDVVTFRYGELKYPDGTVNVMTGVCGQQKRSAANPPGLAEQKDTVVCPAAEGFVYEPRFTFHGFRYVEVAGLRTAPRPDDFEALAWSADVKDSASFECSDEKINRLRDVCRRTFRSNLQGVQSDCPARERFGYGGDLAVTAESLILNYDMAAFYRKVVRDRCDMEALHGVFTSTSPAVFPESGMEGVKKGKGDLRFGWAIDAPVVVDLLLRYYGDMETVREAYPHLRRFLVNCAEAFDVNHVPPCIGDHEALEKADVVATAQCHYHQFLKLTAKFARLLGEAADAERFEATARELEGVFAAAARYVPAQGFVGNGRQGEECFAIYHGMLPPDDLDAAYGILRENVVGHEYALSTGIFSTQYLLEILLARGDAEIAGRVLAHRGFPGWFNMLDNGATTLWETWAPSDNTYSQNHPMFGSCAAWLMRGILGIKVAEDAVGCDKVSIEPHAVAGVTWARGHLDTPKGRISVSWRLEDGRLKVEKVVPPGIAH
jgi:alpha-L-rhamnosidase